MIRCLISVSETATDRNCYNFRYFEVTLSMANAEVECPYCGEIFEGESEADARTKEGVHRAEEHVNDSESTQKASKGRNIIDDWKTEGKRA